MGTVSTALNFLSVFKSALPTGNFQATSSMGAGAISAMIVGAVGAALVAQNVILPFVGAPLTIGEVSAVAGVVNFVVTGFTSDTTKQHIVALAQKGMDCLKTLPTITADYAIKKDDPFAKPEVLPAQAAVAVAVIKAHVEDAAAYPTGKNGA